MEKKVLLKELVDSGTHIRAEFTPKAVVSTNGKYQIGEFWDANKTIDVIVNNSHEQHDNIRELDEYAHAEENRAKVAEKALDDKIEAEITRATTAEQTLDTSKQEVLVSGTNIKTISGQSILGSGNIDIQSTVLANEQMPASWDTTHAMHNLIESINNDNNAVPGKIYLSTIHITDLPAGMSQAEVKVEIMGEQAGKKILLFSITSADRSPYKWEYTAYNMSEGPWRSWLPSTTTLFSGDYNDLTNKPTIPTVPTNVSAFTNDAGYLTSHQDLSSIISRIEALENTINPEV